MSKPRDTPHVPGYTPHGPHVYSVFGRWCYLCGRRKRWWAFWEKWITDDHDEPF